MTNDNQQQPIDTQALASLFRHASRMMARTYHRRDNAHHAQDRVLSIIREHGSINQRELLELLDVRSSSLSEVLRKLENNELITRQRDDNDRRSFVVSATEQAAEHPMDGDGSKESADSLFQSLSDEEREQLHTILHKIVSSLRDDPLSKGNGTGRRGGHGRGRHASGRGKGRRRDGEGRRRNDDGLSEGRGRGSRRGRNRRS